MSNKDPSYDYGQTDNTEDYLSSKVYYWIVKIQKSEVATRL